jgi:Flp pilus assembly protein CpaB
MKKNLAPLVGIAFVVAIISTGIFYGLFVRPMSATQTVAPPALILVAARDLPRGAALAPADVKLAGWPSAAAPGDALTRIEQAKGMILVASVRAGEPVTESRLASASTGAGAGLGIPAGQRAVTVTVHETAGVLAMLKPGHRVDVQVIKQQGSDTELRTILENVQVLHVEPKGENQNRRSMVTLLASPGESDMLTLADSGASFSEAALHPLPRLPHPYRQRRREASCCGYGWRPRATRH